MNSKTSLPQPLSDYRQPYAPYGGSAEIEIPNRDLIYGFAVLKILEKLKAFGLNRGAIDYHGFCLRIRGNKSDRITLSLAEKNLEMLVRDRIIFMGEDVLYAAKGKSIIRKGPNYLKALVVKETINGQDTPYGMARQN